MNRQDTMADILASCFPAPVNQRGESEMSTRPVNQHSGEVKHRHSDDATNNC